MRALFPKMDVLKVTLRSLAQRSVSVVNFFRQEHPRYFWFFVALIVSLMLMAWVDPHVVFFVRHDVPEPIKVFFRAVTDIAQGNLWYQLCAIWLAIAAVGMMRAPKLSVLKEWKYQARCAWFLLCSLIASGLVLIIAKFVIGRYRPRYLWREDIYGFHPFNFNFSALSYPSGHTQVIFCVATVFAILWPRVTIPAYCVAAFFGFSRVMVNAHYPADIVMGAFVGIVVTLMVRDHFHKTGDPLLWRSPFARRTQAETVEAGK